MSELPLWTALPAALLLVLGGCVTLVGSAGLLRLHSFRERLHAPTMGATLGTFCVVVACVLVASAVQGRPIVHEVLISLLLLATSPVTAILLMQSAMTRHGRPPVEPPNPV